MNKSLLGILKLEDDIIFLIKKCKDRIAVFNSHIDIVTFSNLGCEEKRHRIDAYNRLIYDEQKMLEIHQSDLDEVRSEMRDYFMHLFEKGGKNDG